MAGVDDGGAQFEQPADAFAELAEIVGEIVDAGVRWKQPAAEITAHQEIADDRLPRSSVSTETEPGVCPGVEMMRAATPNCRRSISASSKCPARTADNRD